MAAEVRDAAQSAGGVGEGGKSCDGRGQLADVGQIRVDSVDDARTGDGHAGIRSGDHCTHAAEEVTQSIARLRRANGPVANGDGAPGNHGRGDERPGIRQVGLNVAVEGRDVMRIDMPDGLAIPTNRDPVLGQHGDGHVDVGHARDRLADMVHRDPCVESRRAQEEPRHELAGLGCIDPDLTTSDLAGGLDHEGQATGAAVVDLHAEVLQ